MMVQKHCTFFLLFRFNFKVAISQSQRVDSTRLRRVLWKKFDTDLKYPIGERSIKSIQDNSVRRAHVVCD